MSPLRRLAAALSVAALAFLAAAPSRATIVVIPALDEMTRRSEVIVHARVVDQRVVKEDGRILTYTTLEVIEGLKGAKQGDLVSVYQVGGTLDGVVQWIPGNHRYRLHDEIVLFAVRMDEHVVSYGVGVGIFEVLRDEAGVRVVERIGDVSAAVRAKDGSITMTHPTPRGPMALEELKADVRAWVRGVRPLVDPAKLRPLKAPSKALRAPASEGGR